MAQDVLCEITGMDAMTMQPAAGTLGEFTGLLLFKAYHISRGDHARTKIIVLDSTHGTNPAGAAMCGFDVISINSTENGMIDIEKFNKVLGDDTAGLMFTNLNTVGLFDQTILEITRLVHDAGGLCYYDGVNLNTVMGIVRPGDTGFDCVHLEPSQDFQYPARGRWSRFWARWL